MWGCTAVGEAYNVANRQAIWGRSRISRGCSIHASLSSATTMFVARLKMKRGTGSPVNPIDLF